MELRTEQIRILDGQNRDNSDKTIIRSVEKEGILVPLLVYEEDGAYVLVAGHRRLASALHYNLPEVPVQVIPKDQAESARALENLDRKGLHPLDEATEIRTLQGKGYDNEVIAAMLGMPLGRVVRRARLDNLIPEIRESFRSGGTNAAVAEEYSVMDPKDQKKVFKEMKGCVSAGSVRNAYMNLCGINLSECCDTFLGMEPKCMGCKSNLACENTLFDGNKGSCTNGKCYCAKMRELMEKEGVGSLFCPDYRQGEQVVKILQKNGVAVTADGSYWRYNSEQQTPSDVKKMNVWGDVKWAMGTARQAEDPESGTRKKELTKQFRKDIKDLYANLEKMVFEHADAYMSKNHKDERFPDSDERVILAKQVIADNHRAVQFFVTGRYDSKADSVLKGADNRRILAVALFFVATGHMDYDMVRPEKITECFMSTVHLPKSMDIEDIYQLKTSKAKKKVLEIKAEMEQLLEEYAKLEGK